MDRMETTSTPKFRTKHYRILLTSTDVAEIKNAFDILKEQQNAKEMLMERIERDELVKIYKKIENATWIDEFLDVIEDKCGSEFSVEIVNTATMSPEMAMDRAYGPFRPHNSFPHTNVSSPTPLNNVPNHAASTSSKRSGKQPKNVRKLLGMSE